MMKRFTALLIALLSMAAAAPAAMADARTDQKLADAREVFESFSNLTEQTIPSWLLERAYGIVVVPDLMKAALMVGGRGGRGVMAVRQPDGAWSSPVFVTLGGGNFGLQWGVQRTDVVLVLMSRRSVEGIAGGKVTLGADVSVAAGPVGRSASANTDATLKAQVLSYSRNEGLFAGLALDMTVISVDDRSNASAYGVSNILPSQILEGRLTRTPDAAREFTDALTRATTGAQSKPAPGAKPAAPTEAQKAPAAPSTTEPSEPARTYPMEDPAPGAPPPG